VFHLFRHDLRRDCKAIAWGKGARCVAVVANGDRRWLQGRADAAPFAPPSDPLRGATIIP